MVQEQLIVAMESALIELRSVMELEIATTVLMKSTLEQLQHYDHRLYIMLLVNIS